MLHELTVFPPSIDIALAFLAASILLFWTRVLLAYVASRVLRPFRSHHLVLRLKGGHHELTS